MNEEPVNPIDRLQHDLRTPLTVVVGFAELLNRDTALSEEQRRHYAQRILAAADEIREVIRRLDD